MSAYWGRRVKQQCYCKGAPDWQHAFHFVHVHIRAYISDNVGKGRPCLGFTLGKAVGSILLWSCTQITAGTGFYHMMHVLRGVGHLSYRHFAHKKTLQRFNHMKSVTRSHPGWSSKRGKTYVQLLIPILQLPKFCTSRGTTATIHPAVTPQATHGNSTHKTKQHTDKIGTSGKQ